MNIFTRNIGLLIILLSSLTIGNVGADDWLDQFKVKYDFDNWPKNEGIVMGHSNLIKQTIPILQNALTTNDDNDTYMPLEIKSVNEYAIIYRFRWNSLPEWYVEINMGISGSSEVAREYLIFRFTSRTSSSSSVRDIPTIAGDFSFDNGRFFIRNNIVIEIHPEGLSIEKVSQISKQVDEILLKQPAINMNSLYRPIVKNIEFIKVGSRLAKITPDVVDPLGGNIDMKAFYRNGYESFHTENNSWFYRMYEPGTSILPILFVNDHGFNTVAKLHITATENDIFLASSAVNEDRSAESPQVFTLSHNAPNPFNPATVISFRLVRAVAARLAVYDALGREVAMLAEGFLPAGNHEVRWNGRDRYGNPVSSGVYLYRLEVDGKAETRKMTLVR
jgi:hypothetical protein